MTNSKNLPRDKNGLRYFDFEMPESEDLAWARLHKYEKDFNGEYLHFYTADSKVLGVFIIPNTFVKIEKLDQ